jgi:hypothetical protein
VFLHLTTAVEAMDTVRVNSVIQLVDSLRSDCHFIIEPGKYSLSQHPGIRDLSPEQEHKDVVLGSHVRYSSGEGLTFYLLKNVRIEGGGSAASETVLETVRMSDEVLTLLGCENVTLKNLRFTHDPTGEGNIKGGLLKVSQSNSIRMEACELIGRASVGLSTWRSKKIDIENSRVENCSYGICDLRDSWTVRVNGCTFASNKSCQQMWLMSGCTDVKILANTFMDNVQRESKSCEGCHMFKFSRCEIVSIENNVLKGNECEFLGNGEVNRLMTPSNDIKKNKFEKLSSN